MYLFTMRHIVLLRRQSSPGAAAPETIRPSTLLSATAATDALAAKEGYHDKRSKSSDSEPQRKACLLYTSDAADE